MTHQKNATSDVLDRWRMLAEQRLQHLTELFETGRWRRYHSEAAFLENIKEARDAVETWRALAMQKPAVRQVVSKPAPAQLIQLRKIEQASAPIELPVSIPAAAAPPAEVKPAPIVEMVEAAAVADAPLPVIDLAAMEHRYPLLRNAM